MTPVRENGSVRKNKLHIGLLLPRLGVCFAPGQSKIFRLGDGATKKDWIYLRNGIEQSTLTPSNQAADFLLRRANDPINGRSDIRVTEVELSLGEGCLVSIDLRLGGLLC